MEYREMVLDDIVNIRTGKLNSNAAVENGEYVFFTCAPEPLRIDKYKYDQAAILLAGNNADGNFHINYFEGKFEVYQRTYIIDSKDTEKYDLRYIFYALKECLSEFKSMSQGTSTKFLTMAILKAFNLKIPDIDLQRKISQILLMIDEKIKCNNQINRNLSEQARSVYMETFGKFEKTKVLEDYPVKIYSGGTPSTSKKEYWEGGDIHWLSSGETANEFVTTTDKTITQLGVDNSSTKWASKYDVVTASAGQGHTRGQTTMILLNTCINQSVIVTHAAKEYMPFIFFNLSGRYEELRVLSDGTSTRGSLTTKIMAKLKMPDVTENTIIKFSDYAWSAISQIEVNLKENEKLACLRDSLLLKLMTGEIDVSDLNI